MLRYFGGLEADIMKNSLPHKEITIDSLTKASRNKTEVWKSLVL